MNITQKVWNLCMAQTVETGAAKYEDFHFDL